MRSAAMQSLTNDIVAEYPGVTIWGKGDQAHQDHPSDHNEDDTPGSNPAQSDADTTPEHRAIDVKVDGIYFTHNDALDVIAEVLTTPKDLARLKYINYQNSQWSASSGWTEHDNSDDPHPTHIHFSGRASTDEDGSPWLARGGTNMLKATRGMGQNGAPPHDNVLFAQRLMYRIIALVPEYSARLAAHPLSIDGNYGGQTAYWASVIVTGGDGNTITGDHFGQLIDLISAYSVLTHVNTLQHGGGTLPATVLLTIPERSVSTVIPAQMVTAQLNP